MKRLLQVFISFILILFLSACNSVSVEPGDTSKIAKGMSEEEVVEILGKPDIETTDRKKLETTYNSYASLYASEIEYQEGLSHEESMKGWTKVSPFFNAVEEKRNVKVFDYGLSDDYYINVFFLDNEVLLFYELDLSTEK